MLLVMAEKFSDKIGNARPSRMIFGDGAAAMVIAPSDGQGDVEVVQTYASGPFSQVNSIIWPNYDFDNDITVYGVHIAPGSPPAEVTTITGRGLMFGAAPTRDGAMVSLTVL